MNIRNIPVPEVYSDSQDFRFFLDWFSMALEKTQYDTESLLDLYDPLRCPEELLWMLADTMGFRYDDRLCPAFNRLVLLYFMSMIYNRGSRDGMILAADVNVAQFVIQQRAEENEILANRLEDTSIPVNSANVTSDLETGTIDVVYFSDRIPADACIEYVRPIGMYVFQRAGVRFDARTKIAIDARLTDTRDMAMSFGPTFVGHYRRDDYARMQRPGSDPRNPVWYRNSESEVSTNPDLHPGQRALYSLQLANGEEVVKALVGEVFSLGYNPQAAGQTFPDVMVADPPNWNLRYDSTTDAAITPVASDNDLAVATIKPAQSASVIAPVPKVNDVMTNLGDPLSS